ncbi:hypothetical protein T492DRAFT_921592 [Pavlovales sp. CCMP2436]|nr:hypothetical protein T492DRAFT_921592 [Pavlovales sp. CCMP2436]
MHSRLADSRRSRAVGWWWPAGCPHAAVMQSASASARAETAIPSPSCKRGPRVPP